MAFAYEFNAAASSSQQHAREDNGNYQIQHQQCPICLGQLNQPVISTCCAHQFCNQCVRMLPQPDRCPYCRSDRFSARPVVRNSQVQVSQTRQPRQQQSHHEYRCQANRCNFSGSRDAFLTHLISSHGDHVLANHHLMFQNDPGEPQRGHNRHHREPEAAPVATAAARVARNQRFGQNQKMYCGGPLDVDVGVLELEGQPCPCCANTVCGPLDGCNCLACMTMDLLNFGVTHGNCLVNKYGRVASRSSETGKFYCTGILDVSEQFDGDIQVTYCGPIEGPNCDACTALDEQSRVRYASLM